MFRLISTSVSSRFLVPIVAVALCEPGAWAGILITKAQSGYQFGEAFSVTVNGKDKASSLGADPHLSGAPAKLQSVKIAGTLEKNADTGIIAMAPEGAPEYLFPENIGKGAPRSPLAAWQSAAIAYKKGEKDKEQTAVPYASFVAFLAGGVEELAELCGDTQSLEFIGGKNKAFATQLDLIRSAAKTYGSDPAFAPVERLVRRAMQERYERFEGGLAGTSTLEEALELMKLSADVYAASPEQDKLRRQIAAEKLKLDRRVAILRAFAAADAWDPFLVADRDFEKYHRAFPQMADLEAKALKASLDTHRAAGEARIKEKDFGGAFREFRAASLRKPSDAMLEEKALEAWTEYSSEHAIDHRRERRQLAQGELAVINEKLLFATNYKEQNKLDLAARSLQEAEAVDPTYLPVLLKKAEILGAQRQFAKAFNALDEYDLRAVDEERQKSGALRADLRFKQSSTVEEVKAQLAKTWEAGNYIQARDLTRQGLAARDDDAELLFEAGTSALVMRDRDSARQYFTRYLEVSNTLDANQEQRVRVRSMMAAITGPAAAVPKEGKTNWLSGEKLPSGVYYSPYSLAFQPKIERLEASGKMRVAWEWDGDKLKSITPAFDKAEHATGEKRVAFAYDPKYSQVESVAYGDNLPERSPSVDPEPYKRSCLVVWNNPYIDPSAVQQLTGKNISQLISGNRYFNPFVWDKVHYFQGVWDDRGRLTQARELSGPGGAPLNFSLAFEWDGLELQSIVGYEEAAGRRTQVYERQLRYEDGRLASEEIRAQGKTSRIRYEYKSGKLVSATAEHDATLDDRSRQVSFE